MKTEYTERAKQWRGHYLLQNVSKQLEEIAGPAGESVSARWTCYEDERGLTYPELTLCGFGGCVEAAFSLNELKSPSHMRLAVLDLWGDLLQKQSNEQVKKLEELIKQGS
jgi:hypothetical protein